MITSRLSHRPLSSLFVAALLLALPGCPPADPGAGSAAPAAPAATAPPAAEASEALVTESAPAEEGAAGEVAEGSAGEATATTGVAPDGEAEAARAAAEAAKAAPKQGDVAERGDKDDVVDEVFGAFKAGDFAKIEGFRAKLDKGLVDEVMTHYKTSLSWDIKDGFTHLMVHRTEAVVIPLMVDSLSSKRLESRAQAIATLRQAKDMIGTMQDAKGAIEASKVADAIKEYKSENPD